MTRADLAKQYALLASTAAELATLAGSVRDRCNRQAGLIRNGMPVGHLACPGASDLPALAVRIARIEGRVDLMLLALFDDEEKALHPTREHRALAP